MGIYIFNWDILRKYLIEDEENPDSENDFGNNIIPNLLKDGRRMYAYHFDGYWKDVGTIPSLWEANMEVLDPEHSGINLFDENWKIYSRNSGMTGHKISDGGVVENFHDHRRLPYCRHRTPLRTLRRRAGRKRRRCRGCCCNGRNCHPFRCCGAPLYCS